MSAYELDWSFGLISSAGKYLTAETFQNKIGATAGVMKKKQIFFLESEGDDTDYVSIRTHLGKYLGVDGDGKFLAGYDKGDEESHLKIDALPDGRWNISSKKYGWYIGGSGENLSAFTMEKDAEHNKWTVHLAMHPQVCIKNIKRKRYMHLSGSDQQPMLTCDEDIPWGHDATVQVTYLGNGTYGIQASNGLFLSSKGSLVGGDDQDAKFILEFQGKYLSFKSLSSGKYVTALGATGICKATKAGITKDEQFIMEDSWPQVSLKASNGKYVSIKGGVELAANSAQVTDTETFQIEPDNDSNWIIKTSTDNLWTSVDAGVSAVTKATDLTAASAPAEAKFKITFMGTKIAIAPIGSGKPYRVLGNSYLSTKDSEHPAEFEFAIINRPVLILRGEHGFVGVLPSGLLECNKSTPYAFDMQVVDGNCQISDPASKKYWKVTDTGVSCIGDAPENYNIELFPESKLALKSCESGKYFAGSQNGAFTCSGSSGNSQATLFEY